MYSLMHLLSHSSKHSSSAVLQQAPVASYQVQGPIFLTKYLFTWNAAVYALVLIRTNVILARSRSLANSIASEALHDDICRLVAISQKEYCTKGCGFTGLTFKYLRGYSTKKVVATNLSISQLLQNSWLS
ncbi:hypothetical protein C5167_050114 [Papaver somniferum]|uniref:Uncharacterized protein n=1 Tax=Papaver somniferum TaxID=3469 RepID=A0A4Y7KMQ8_PAPSO|nr:hypothetical protein C5167_050114 [Papaver somniferum]